MAYKPVNINPLDLKPSTGIGISIPFDNQSAFTTVYTTKDQLRNNVINYLLTDKRERYFNPGFGAGLRSRLFEQMTPDNLEGLEAAIKEDIQLYFPRVLVTDIKITPSYDQNYFTLTFKYNILNTGNTDQVILNFFNSN